MMENTNEVSNGQMPDGMAQREFSIEVPWVVIFSTFLAMALVGACWFIFDQK